MTHRTRSVVAAVVALLLGMAIAGGVARGGAAPGPARHAPAITATAGAADVARALARSLADRGRLSVPVDVVERALSRSNGYAEFDFAARRCIVSIDPARMRGSPYTSAIALRYFVYHELSHCELYARPGVFVAAAPGQRVAARMLDDLVLFDSVDSPEDRPGLNLFALQHEAYADVRALALLMEEGIAPRELSFAIALRDGSPFDANHGTAGAIRALLALPQHERSGTQLESGVRLSVARFLVHMSLRQTFASSDDLATELRNVLWSRRMSVFGRARAGEPIVSAPLLGNGDRHPEALDEYRSVQWLFRHAGELVAASSEEAALVERWLTASYGAQRRDQLQAAAGVLRDLLQSRRSGDPPELRAQASP